MKFRLAFNQYASLKLMGSVSSAVTSMSKKDHSYRNHMKKQGTKTGMACFRAGSDFWTSIEAQHVKTLRKITEAIPKPCPDFPELG